MSHRPDPREWIDRLLQVNSESQFTSDQKIVIREGLRRLLEQLGGNAPRKW